MRDTKLPKWVEENIASISPELLNSTLFKFKAKLQVITDKDENSKPIYKEIEVNLLPDLDLDYEMLEDQMQDIPAQYAFWSTVYSEVRMSVAVAERKLKMRYGQAYEKVQKEFEANKIKPTIEVIKRIVEKDSEIVKTDIEYQKLQMQAGKLYHMLEALKMKSELARSLAGFKRNESN